MVCLTSCVFRSIRFSGFARPHIGVRREGELYTRLQAEGKGGRGESTRWTQTGKNSSSSSFLRCGRAPADSRGPTGRFPLHAETRTPHVAHVAGFGSPACTGASPCFPERQDARQAGPSHVQGPRSPSPPLSPCGLAGPLCIYQEPGPGRRAGRTRRRAHPLPNARHAISRPTMAKAATRPIKRASLPAAPRPGGLPPPAQKSPHPKATLGCGLKKAGAGSYLPYFAAAWRRAALALTHSTTPTARTPTIAVTQAAKSPKCRAGIPMSRPTT